MDYSPLVDRIAGEGAAAWEIHNHAIDAQARGEDVVVMSVGDPDLDTPAPIVEAAVDSMHAGHTHYADLIGELPLREAIAQHFAAHGGWSAGPEHVCVVCGAQNGLFFASMLLFKGGDEVIVLQPNYVTYEATIAVSGARQVPVPTREEDGFRPDPAAIEAAITPRTRALLITNPNNPTGVVMTSAELEAIAAIARKHDLWVISDEVYGTLTFGVEHRSIAALPGMAERTVTVSSLSKSHAMTGWRSGWLIGPEALIRHAENLALCVLYGLPGFVQRAATVAVQHADEIAGRMRDIYHARRDLVVERLAAVPSLRVVAGSRHVRHGRCPRHRPVGGRFLLAAHARAGGLGARCHGLRAERRRVRAPVLHPRRGQPGGGLPAHCRVRRWARYRRAARGSGPCLSVPAPDRGSCACWKRTASSVCSASPACTRSRCTTGWLTRASST